MPGEEDAAVSNSDPFASKKPPKECPLWVVIRHVCIRPRLCENSGSKTPNKKPTPPEARRTTIGIQGRGPGAPCLGLVLSFHTVWANSRHSIFDII